MLAPWADCLYACDGEWWDKYIVEVRDRFKGELWTQDEAAAKRYGLHRVSGADKPGLGKNGLIHFGGNSGHQMINLAYLFGAARIILLGFDMQRTDGKSHHHGDHPGNLNKSLPFHTWMKKFPLIASDLKAEGVEVINCTRKTALNCFEKRSLEEVLCV